ncbi:fibronectin type III domain-containing protein-like [Xenia sp. Carnegie-2017]|uniref:fibronectin type III domain-containing protein-like n=1 Tax=Xenia sp. Carnegie-2017 TaxID=2897299 RepID=UPI001F03BEC3|nr:fibronectin type III domain-containing protein-like [Xenia sp. Carnegie-2017]
MAQTLKIKWKAVPKIYENGPGFGYNVSYRITASKWKHELVYGKEYILMNMSVDEQWAIQVQSINAKGNGPECPIKRSASEAPTVAPKSFKHKEIGSDYVLLKWDSVHGPIEGYKLSYWYEDGSKTRVKRAVSSCVGEKNACVTFIKNVMTTQYRQGDLQPFKNYTMYLQAYNQIGPGPKSNHIKVSTKEGKPGVVHDVSVTSYGRYLHVQWKPPIEANGIIVGYQLRINSSSFTVGSRVLEYLFNKLQPKTEYVVFITAETNAGSGEAVSTSARTTDMRTPAVARPPIVEAIDEDSVNVTYVPSSKEGGYPEKFYIVYKEKEDDKNLKDTDAIEIKKNGQKSFIQINDLDDTKVYLFATVVTNGDLKSNWSDFAEGRTISIRELKDDSSPIYREVWFYIILILILLLLLLLLLLLYLRRKPKQTYNVSDRERKRKVYDTLEMGDEQTFTEPEVTFAPPQRQNASNATVPQYKDPLLKDNDSLEEYGGSDDDF